MKIVLKFLGILIGAVVLAVSAVALYLEFSFDPNAYKGEITAWVKRHTGRELSIRGPVSLALFPTLGLRFSDVTLGNAPGFATRAFAHIARGEVAVRLLPMLEERRVEARLVSLQGLELNLETDRGGRGNWQDLTAAAPAVPAPPGTGVAGTPASPQPPPEYTPGERVERWLAGLAIGGIDVRDAHVQWRDMADGRRIDLRKLYLNTAAVLPRQPFTLRAGADVTAAGLKGHVDLHGLGVADPAAWVYGVDDLHITARAAGPRLPGRHVVAGKLRSDLRYDVRKRVLTLSGIAAEVLGATAGGHIKVEQVTSSPAVAGTLAFGHVNVRKLINAFRDQPVLTEDSDVLGWARGKLVFDANSLQVDLKYVHVEMDDSLINGTAELTDFSHPRARFRAYIDSVDLDRYLPPAASGHTATPAAMVAAGAQRLSPQTLRNLDVAGEIAIGSLKAAGLQVQNLKLPLHARGGVIDLQPEAALYNGRYRGHIDLDARRDTPHLAFDEYLDAVQLGPLLTDLTGQGFVSGVADVHTRFDCLDARGRLLSSLEGTARFDVKNGAVHGLDIPWLVAAAKAKLKGAAAPPAAADPHTDFTALSGTLAARNGILSNDDLIGQAPLLHIAGKGRMDLASGAVDYRSQVTFVTAPQGQGGAEPADLRGMTVPVRIGGTLSKPVFSVDVGDYVRKRLEGEVDKALGRHLDDPQLNALKGRVQHTLEKLLGN